jgi:hypothetical protein
MESQTGHEVSAILVDRNIEGPSVMLWGTFAAGGWLELLPMTTARFADVGLPFDSSDRTVWRFAQEHGMLLLTDNRSRRGENSLEQTISEENSITSLPVLTIGNVARIVEQAYREQCVIRLIEIVLDLYLFNKTGLKAYALAGCHEEGIAGIMAPEQCPPPLEPAAICLKTLT